MDNITLPEFTKSVIVVGAGPVGLLIALRLARAGIKVEVLEKESQLDDKPRAVGYYAGALCALQSAGVLEKVKSAGFLAAGLSWRKPLRNSGKGEKRMGDVLAQVRVGDSEAENPEMSGIVYLRQPKLAKLLYDEAVATGLVDFYFNTELIHIEDDGMKVRASTRRAADTPGRTVFEGTFLVGADGAKSATRRLLGIQFKGHSWPERIVAIDLLLCNDDVDPQYPTSIIVHPVNFGVVTPLEPTIKSRKTLYRCSVAVDVADPRSDEELASEASVHELLEKMVPGPRPLDVTVLGSSSYKTHQLLASTLRRGRCVLAGDAGHLNNPFGAMGLTTGLIDAEAVADTFELIMHEAKPLSLLDVYSDERRKAFMFFVDPHSTQNKLRAASEPELAHEDWFFRSMANPTPEQMMRFQKPFFEVWRTDIRTITS